MKLKLEIGEEGIMKWQGREDVPGAVMDKLEDAMACFPRGTVMEIEWRSDAFSEFELPE